jgi:DNA-binding FrmR family transcriptional regulator
MTAPGNTTTHFEARHRLARIAGQVQGIQRMIDEQKYCINIITQIQAVRSALRAVELQILHKHMTHCVQDAFTSGSSADAAEKMEELLRVMKKQA